MRENLPLCGPCYTHIWPHPSIFVSALPLFWFAPWIHKTLLHLRTPLVLLSRGEGYSDLARASFSHTVSEPVPKHSSSVGLSTPLRQTIECSCMNQCSQGGPCTRFGPI